MWFNERGTMKSVRMQTAIRKIDHTRSETLSTVTVRSICHIAHICEERVRPCMRAEHLSALSVSRGTRIQREWNISSIHALVIDHGGIPRVPIRTYPRTWSSRPSIPIMSVPSWDTIFFSFLSFWLFLQKKDQRVEIMLYIARLRKYNRIVWMHRTNLEYR